MPKVRTKHEAFSDINVIKQTDGSLNVVACFKIDHTMIIGEGTSKIALAIDASQSIRKMYGGSQGILFGEQPNYMQIISRKLGQILLQISSEDAIEIFYWAIDRKGDKLEMAGTFSEENIDEAKIIGPKIHTWGRGTRLLPTLRYIAETHSLKTDFYMAVIITDGIIEDEKECIDYCIDLGHQIDEGKRNAIKLILIGIGEEVDHEQLERFDDMFEGTALEDRVDIWSHGIAQDIQDETAIIDILFGELMTDDIIVAPSGQIRGSNGDVLEKWSDGLPGKIRFTLPMGSTHFILETSNQKIQQSIEID